MDRKEELLKVFEGVDANTKITLEPMIDEVIFLEDKLIQLKKLPFIRVHPDNPELQKATPAAKQYKELLQQYTNCIKVLSRAVGDDGSDEESPLRKWMRQHVNSE